MNKKLFIFLLVFLLVLPFVCSAPPVTTTQQFTVGYVIEAPIKDYYKLLQDYKFNIHVYNISNGMPVLNQSTSCNFHLYNTSGNHIVKMSTTKIEDDADFEFLVKGGNFSKVGE